MTKLEKRVLDKILENMKNPSSGSDVSTEYAWAEGGMTVTKTGNIPEGVRRLDSEDYKLGWEKCWEDFKARLDFLKESSPKDQQKYAGRG
jgi:hypothetical protein